MGRRTVTSGGILSEMTARHATAKPVIGRLRHKFFNKTDTNRASKLMVGNSLILSKDLFGAGAWPILSSAEEHRLHSNLSAHFRMVLGERYVDTEVEMLSDIELFRVHELRPPMVFLRFARLRLSVTVALKASYELLSLLYLSRGDRRSWLRAVVSDLEWMARVGSKSAFAPQEWFSFCQNDPAAARRLIRKVCESKAALVQSVAEFRPSIARSTSYTCHCGKVCKSLGGLATHKFLAHGDRAVTAWFADASGQCACCGTKFDNRTILMAHLSRGSPLCLLNILLTSPPLSQAAEGLERAEALLKANENKKSGFAPSKVAMPSFRAPWVSRRIFDAQGKEVDFADVRHPCRSLHDSGMLDAEIALSDSEEEFIANLS